MKGETMGKKNKRLGKILVELVAGFLMIGLSLTTPLVGSQTAWADGEEDSNCIDTGILGEDKGDGSNQVCDEGNGTVIIKEILMPIVDIMTAGVGILAVIGITVVGIQYLTAGGSEEQTRKAKRRMLEIVIGIALYISVYAILKWLLPGFNESSSGSGNSTGGDPESVIIWDCKNSECKTIALNADRKGADATDPDRL